MASGYPDFMGDKAGLYLIPEWAAKEGNEKVFIKSGANVAVGDGISDTYEVPAGSTLYITEGAFSISANAAGDRNNNQIGVLSLYAVLASDFTSIGGNGGGQVLFPKPFKVEAGETLTMALNNRSNHAVDLYYSFHGYELTE